MTSVDQSSAQSSAVQVNLPGGYVLTATLKLEGNGNVKSRGFPTYGDAFLGNTGANPFTGATEPFYTGVSGQPALYQTASGGLSTVSLNDIKLFNSQNQRVNDYAMVVADAESTDSGEHIDWTTTGAGFSWLPNRPPVSGTTAEQKTKTMGNACSQSFTPALNGSSQSATCYADTSPKKNGTAMLQTKPPTGNATFNLVQTMKGNGLQAVAFGVVVARAGATVEVKDRIVDASGAATASDFGVSMTRSSGDVVGSTTASGSATPMQNANSVDSTLPVGSGSSGTQLQFASQITNEPNSSIASSYTPSWTCTKTDPASTVVQQWPTSGSSSTPPASNESFTKLQVGEYLHCTVTYTPPYLILQKTVDNSTTDGQATARPEDFRLTAKNAMSAASTNGVSDATTQKKIAVASTTGYELSESAANSNNPWNSWKYGYELTGLTCATPSGAKSIDLQRDTYGAITRATNLAVDTGETVTCTWQNTAKRPLLVTTKASDPQSGTTVSPSDDANASQVKYKLTFDNTQGTAAVDLDHVDHLRDVLDDASFDHDSIWVSDGTETGYKQGGTTQNDVEVTDDTAAQSPVLNITGSVPRAQTRTVWFTVTVKPNASDDAQSRQNAVKPLQGYLLRNYLTAHKNTDGSDVTPPETCEASNASCTQNPIRAWTIEKNSQPEDGAIIHSGGNIYYRVKVTNYSNEDLSGITLKDDLSETLAATTWDPTAPPAVPVQYGVSYYDSAGNRIASMDTPWNAATGPKPVYEGDTTFNADRPNGRAFSGTWTLTVDDLTLPALAPDGTTKVAYAVVGYAVRGGTVADTSDPAQAYLNEGTPLKSVPNAIWTNTAQGQATTSTGQPFYPNRCSSGDNDGAGVPAGDDSRYYDCKTWHSLGENYFHIWKKSATTPENTQYGPVGKNLLDSTFVLADSKANAEAGIPSRWLCRKTNNPTSPDYQAPGSVTPSETLGDDIWDFGAGSATAQSIIDWNAAHPQDQRAACGTFYYLDEDNQGQSAGSWRGVDVRGGDTAGPDTTDPKVGWRTTSAQNAADDAGQGIHGTYWLVEVQSPRDYQLLAQPMKIWVAPTSPTPTAVSMAGPGTAAWYDYQGRLSLPVAGEGEASDTNQKMAGTSLGGQELRPQCVSPYQLPADSQPNCVMPTGWTMPVFDVQSQSLPLTGGRGIAALGLGGGVVLVGALVGVIWRRRRARREA
ncbi:DUF7927 domain-containing protein [Pseudoclavibacter sp. 13-3]|uniref:DUF7927 domain-containing protein n=1 Tax=Pseudoclavibacter sp. 13-3 TaxID=2901228 RepID=UPI001E3EC146|nr:hypothetical protein [Pseudoclavibacter sp. 13-3]MCD7101127.1 hypothetical protein [Pseudoclavibacter sp. 13-3]